ncbi:hypothetical protein A3K48_01650 [candidate division WOR-1 bacterium RIFOXYA12_FULL_52_29]|uniref:Uncharacterized protein n=1 Tax=candidate division WOR-1 bacterium RIFOXYC12_FULL_54_18 TaxID=1802584 RepID=A0A1F4T4H7_UNCSA|nr:MAG: hypothetical protein A3K44_01650 [candidate division WOR-1 bacterium RIFOXYA2_FULL_51_19]OGC17288.1 MAG: hypothetical protein A3K48_01650 [candidate division WOR-1 bacterium RIFOXYA12_FULL_52_29]OGC26148.1 MAG: hypothetical protein A3K32_01645 [candidate division WOR-1 bacterium RIFOXYB2_FULL_45_9]OGC27705.1 MAG: hypothetical protein A3K49_01650 [candidate division WOR-1 bacterium RIFOXYC12_FULL_54_18]OGC30004.1 MAG: hypothetical protein A2346_04685 [candidate division WOR-1 bacterium R
MKEMRKKLDLILGTMATKSDLSGMATKDDLAGMATKADLTGMANKSDISRLEKDLKEVKYYVEHIDSELQEHRHDSEVHSLKMI